MSVETEVRELKEKVEQLENTLNELMGVLQSGSGAGSPGPPQLDEEN